MRRLLTARAYGHSSASRCFSNQRRLQSSFGLGVGPKNGKRLAHDRVCATKLLAIGLRINREHASSYVPIAVLITQELNERGHKGEQRKRERVRIQNAVAVTKPTNAHGFAIIESFSNGELAGVLPSIGKNVDDRAKLMLRIRHLTSGVRQKLHGSNY